MNKRGTSIQGVLAAGAMGIAFMLAQSRESIGLNEAVVVEAKAADIQGLKYFDGKRTYTVWPDSENNGDLLVHVTAGERFGQRGMPSEKIPDRDLKGGRLAKDLWAAFAPLKAMRALGKLPPDRMKSLGLSDTPRRLTVKVRGIERTFRLATPPPGAVEPYLMAEDTGVVFVVSRLIMNSFSERALGPDAAHAFASYDFDRLTITPVGKEPLTLKSVRGEGTDSHLVAQSSIKANAASIQSWHQTLFSVPAEDALGKGETPKFGEPQVQYRLEYWLGRDRQGWMDIALGTSRGQPLLFFRSEQSLGWMVGPQGSAQLIAQADSLFKG